MRTVELVPGIRSSRLGFGCAPMMGSVDRSTSLRALACARDQGITHFDIAPSYGYGEAESLLGEFLAGGKSDDVVIATKYGIEATRVARYLRPAKGVVRRIKPSDRGTIQKSSPAVRGAAGSAFFRHVDMSGTGLTQSVERSLNHLKRERLDFLFLHEPREALLDLDEMMRAAEALKQSGKLGAFGLALWREDVNVHQDYLGRFDVLQFDAPPLPDSLPESLQRPSVLFAPFRFRSEEISHKERLSELAGEFTGSVVLCSMYSEANIKANAAVLRNAGVA